MSAIPAEWLPLLHRRHLIRVLGGETVVRGARYAEAGRVSDVEVSNLGIRADVSGTRAWPYSVLITIDGDISGVCTCPVGDDCKHVAAVAIHVAHEMGADSTWEERLAALMPASVTPSKPLALQFELVNVGALSRPRLRFRPARPGKRDNWVRTGVGWNELAYGYGYAGDHPGRQTMLALRRASEAANRGWSEKDLDLAEVGPGLWPLLDQLVRDGVELVHGSTGQVVIGAPVAPQVHVRGTDTGAIEVQGGWSDTGLHAPHLLGDPPFGLVELHDDSLVLHRLDPLPDGATTALLTGPPITVPAVEVPRFRQRFLPGLRRLARLSSPDDSVEIPAQLVPELVARVTHGDHHTTEVDLQFRYRAPDDDGPGIEVPLGETGEGWEFVDRDPVREQQLIAEIADLFRGGPHAHHRLTGRDTVRFVTETMPGLAEAGITIEQDGEATDYTTTDADPLVEFVVEDKDTDWFNLDLAVTVDGQAVPLIPLIRSLAVGDMIMVLDSGLVLDLTHETFVRMREMLAVARTIGDPEKGPLQLRPEHIGVWEELQGYGIAAAQADRWRRIVDTALAEVDAAAPAGPPEGLEAELRGYQLAGYGWLDRLWRCGLGGILADDMGLGKTIQALAAILSAKHRAGEDWNPVLVVAPTSVVPNWVSEAGRFTPGLVVRSVRATKARRRSDLVEVADGADIVVTSYSLLRLEGEAYADLDWSAMLLDEAQQVKNFRAKGYRAVRKIGSPITFVVTGTPLENNLMELWAMLSLAAPGLFPDPEVFSTDVRLPIEKGNVEVLSRLRRRIRPLMLRRTKDVVARDLPDKQEQILTLDLSAGHRKAYDLRLARERQRVLGLLADLDDNRVEVLQALTALRQLALSPTMARPAHEPIDPQARAIGSVKVDTVAEMVAEVAAEGHQALVFSQFTRFLDLVAEKFDRAGVRHTRIDGSLSITQRDQAVEQFRSGGADAFLISLKAGGFGLNLTEADYVFVMDPWWNPAAENQAIDRAHRIGQTRPVNVYRLIAGDTIEEKVAALQHRKRDLFARVIDADVALSDPRMTADDIREIFS